MKTGRYIKYARPTAFFALLLLLLQLAVPARAAAALADDLPKISIQYFYMNPCASCNEEGRFYDLFDQTVGSAREGVAVEILCYNTFQSANETQYRDLCRQFGIPEGEQKLPMVIINGAWLCGAEAIEARLREVFLTEKAKVLAETGLAKTASTLLYFYVSPCEECAAVKQFIDKLDGSYPIVANDETVQSPLAIVSYNIADPESLEIVRELFIRYQVPEDRQKAPILFLRDDYLSGEEEITGRLVAMIKNGAALGTKVIDAAAPAIALQPYEWPGIFVTGLVNGLNPCSISMLLFLIALLLARNASVIKIGFSFIAGKTIAYLTLGTVLFSLLSAIDNSIFKLFQDAMKYILLAVVLAVAAVNVWDFVAAKNERYNKIRLQLPVSLRKFNHSWMKKLTETPSAGLLLLSAFALGLLISAGEFLCTGQIYLATILYMIKRSPSFDLQTLSALLVYVLGMMIPLILLTLAVWKGKQVFHLSEFARRNLPLVKLVNAAVFLAFGVILFFTL